jgi:hypothetical protein
MSPAPIHPRTSRRPPDLDDCLDILRRRRVWILAALFAGVVISVVAAFLTPDLFISRATLTFQPGTTLLTQQLQSVALTAGALSDIIKDPSLNLYPLQRQKLSLLDVIRIMKDRDLRIVPLATESGTPALLVQFQYTDRYKVVQVVQALVNRLLEQTAGPAPVRNNRRDDVSAAREKKEAAETALARFELASAHHNVSQPRRDEPMLDRRRRRLHNQIAALEHEQSHSRRRTRLQQNRLRREISAKRAELNNLARQRPRLPQPIVDRRKYAALLNDLNLANAEYDEKLRLQSSPEPARPVQPAGQLGKLDGPALPERLEPNRGRWILIGSLMGLLSGLLLAATLEVRDKSLKNLKDIRAYTNLPVLTSLPPWQDRELLRKRRRMALLAWSAAALLGIVLMSGSVYYYMSNVHA